LFDVLDYQNIDRGFSRFEAKTELILQGF